MQERKWILVVWAMWLTPLGLVANSEASPATQRVKAMEQWVEALVQHPRTSSKPADLIGAGMAIEGFLAQLNLDFKKQPVAYGASTFYNYSVAFGPSANDWTVVGAHYDSVPGSVGADDNASGVAVLLALASELKALKTLKTKVALVFFALEEQPHFQSDSMGSRVYVEELSRQGIAVRSMVNLEMVGYFREEPGSQLFPDPAMARQLGTQGDFLALVGRLGKDDDLVAALLAFKSPDLRVIPYLSPEENPHIHRSDHASFWEKGMTAVMITDTGELRNPNYHQPTDTLETLDFARMAALVDHLRAWLSALSAN